MLPSFTATLESEPPTPAALIMDLVIDGMNQTDSFCLSSETKKPR
jgi:hypothetical protein